MNFLKSRSGHINRASLVAQAVKNLPVMWEAWVKSLGREDPLEEGLAAHSSILAWEIPWTAAYQAPLSMGFSRQEHWSGVPLPSPMSSRFR